MVFVRLLIMSLLVLLPSSSFFWPVYIEKQLNKERITQGELTFSLSHSHQPSLVYQMNLYPPYSEKWLKMAVKVGNFDGNIAYKLAEYFEAKQDFIQMEMWLTIGSELKHLESIITLAKRYLLNGQFEDLTKLYFDFSELDSLLPFIIEMEMAQGETEKIATLMQRLKTLPLHAELYNELLSYRLNDERENILKPKLCDNSIQFFSTTLAGLRRVSFLIKEFQHHPLSPYFCFNKPRYVSKKKLVCNNTKTKLENRPIQCQEHKFPVAMQTAQSKYLGLLLPEGGANVYQGVMYIDMADSPDVFAHELAHFIGFVDEYSLKEGHSVCQRLTDNFANNIVILPKFLKGERQTLRQDIIKKLPWGKFIDSNTPILTPHQNGWLVGYDNNTPINQNSNHSKNPKKQDKRSNEAKEDEQWPKDLPDQNVGLYAANTCSNNNLATFKPLKQRTQLEYYETAFPSFYITLYRSLAGKYHMPSYKEIFNQ